MARHRGRRHAGRRRRQRHQHGRRPRHRQADGTARQAGRSSPARSRPGPPSSSPSPSRCSPSSSCGLLVNLLSAVLAVSATLFYVFVYTLWLKRRSTAEHRHRRGRRRRARARRLVGRDRQPRLGAGRAVRHHLRAGPRRTSGPSPSGTATTTRPPTCRCCPAVASLGRHRPPHRRLHGRAVGASSVLFAEVGRHGRHLPGDGHRCSARCFLWLAVKLLRDGTPAGAMRLFGYSISYVTLLFSSMALDQLVRR